MAAAEPDVPTDVSPEPEPEPSPDAESKEDSSSEVDAHSEDDWRPRNRRRSSRSRREDSEGAGAGAASGTRDTQDFSDEGLRVGYKILQDLLKTNSTFLHKPKVLKGMIDYFDVIEKPVWFIEIKRRYENAEYLSITQFVSDVRLLLSNTYRYFGPNTVHTKRALRIEQVLEHKLSLVSKEIRNLCTLEITNGITLTEEEQKKRDCLDGEFYSILLGRFSEERAKRERMEKELLNEERVSASSGVAKEALVWESDTLLAPPAITQLRTMWELPLIGHFINLASQVLHIDEVPQFELERVCLMPQASKTLARLMTSLLSPPLQRPKLHLHPPMPYSIWSRKLFQKVASWYKLYNARQHDASKLFALCGIEKEFWDIMGEWNQLEDYEFHELSFHQRVWLVKTLCDYLVHHHKTMQDALADHSQTEQDCEILGEDRHKRQYLHFPQFYTVGGMSTCVRVYRRMVPLETSKPDEVSKQPPKQMPSVRAKGDFFPSWMQQRGRKKGKRAKKSILNRKLGLEINNRNFLSRLVYRMPNGMYIKQSKKRRQLSSASHQQTNKPTDCGVAASESPVNIDAHEEDKEQLETCEENSRRLTRHSRNTSMGLYAEWSESDSQGASSPNVTPCKKAPTKKRAFASLSVVDTESSRGSIKLKLVSTSSRKYESDESNSDESDVDHKFTNDSFLDSGCDDGTSRSSCWTTQNQNAKVADFSVESDEDVETNSCDKHVKELGDSLAEDTPLIMTKKDTDKDKRPLYDPHWLLLGAEHFELVAESVQGIRDLIDSLCESDEDINLNERTLMNGEETRPLCEKKLEQQLINLIEEVRPLELKMERNVHKLRCKLFDEWKEFCDRPAHYVDESESFWVGLLSQCLDATTSKEISTDSTVNLAVKDGLNTNSENTNDGGDIRHSLRAKKPKVDILAPWLDSDSDLLESDDEDELDDSWEMPSHRKKRKSGSVESSEKKISKTKKALKKCDITSNLLIEQDLNQTGGSLSETGSPKPECDSSKTSKNNRRKILPNKLTLDKEGNMFITLGCGTKVQLKTDSDGKIVVPDGHEGLSMIHGKTLEQLVGTGKVIQNKKNKQNKTKRSTTLFPATPISTSESESWLNNIRGTSLSVTAVTPSSLKTIPCENNTLSKVSKEESSASPCSPKTTAPRFPTNSSVQQCPPKTNDPEEIVILSDESDDSIEVIKEAKPKNTPPQNGVPRIQSVVGNAHLNTFASKPLTKSVTLTPVISSSKSIPPKTNQDASQWNPVISHACSLEQRRKPLSVSRVKPPGAPEVVITPAKGVNVRRNLQQTNAFQQPPPNENFTIPVRPSQSQFVPVTQIIPTLNQPVALNNQFVIGNVSFPPLVNQYPLNTQSYQFLTVQPPAPAPQALPISAHEIGLPPGLLGQIVLANCDNNQYSYAFKLDDGGLIFLSNQQISKIRNAHGGKLPQMITFCTQ